MTRGFHQLGRAITCEVMFRAWIGHSYGGAAWAARRIFARRFLRTPEEMAELDRATIDAQSYADNRRRLA